MAGVIFVNGNMSETPEQQPMHDVQKFRLDVRITQTHWGSIGILGEYPTELAEKITELSREFPQIESKEAHSFSTEPGFGDARDKFVMRVVLPQDKEQVLFIKNRPFTSHVSMAWYRESKKEHRLEDASESWRDSTILNEISANRRAAALYKDYYKEELPIEKPVGFVIFKDGRKWSIFEYIPDIIPFTELSDEVIEGRQEFAGLMYERLYAVGIYAHDLSGGNVVTVRDTEHQNSLRFIIIDTETWLPMSVAKKYKLQDVADDVPI